MKATVKTLRTGDFERHCRSLEALVLKSGYRPDLVVGIRTGGALMADIMFRDVAHAEVGLQRATTRHKRRISPALIRLLPTKALDAIRRFESWVLSRRKPKPRDIKDIDMGSDRLRGHRILVVDDAVDSGATLDAVCRAVRRAVPGAKVRTAVITVTTEKPLVTPNYTLYNNRTLIRFPWSMDMKH